MRLSDRKIKKLQELLRAEYGAEYSTEQAQEVGFAIMRFVVQKYGKQRPEDEA